MLDTLQFHLSFLTTQDTVEPSRGILWCGGTEGFIAGGTMPNEGPWNATAKPFPTPAALYYLSVSFRKWNAISTNRYLFRERATKQSRRFYLRWHNIFRHEADARYVQWITYFSYYSNFLYYNLVNPRKINTFFTQRASGAALSTVIGPRWNVC